MARVRSVGGIATISRYGEVLGEPESTTVSLNVRLFAKLDNGLLAIDPGVQSFAVGVQRSQLGEVEQILELVRLASLMEVPAEIRNSSWARLLEVLEEQHGTRTDAETLQSLPFDFAPDGELRELIES